MIYIIYMAAGQSRRYGTNKLLELRNGVPLYRYGLEALKKAVRERTDCTLTVVTCWNEIACSIKAEQEMTCVFCENSHLGISHTIRAGIRACEPFAPEDYLCFCVADQPLLLPETLERLLDTVKDKPLTSCLCADGVQGNPVLFHASLAPELCTLEGDRGGKAVMRAHPERHIDVACSSSELMDIDVKE
jgi:molybdenum cofactor cytidylyltransferase